MAPGPVGVEAADDEADAGGGAATAAAAAALAAFTATLSSAHGADRAYTWFSGISSVPFSSSSPEHTVAAQSGTSVITPLRGIIVY